MENIFEFFGNILWWAWIVTVLVIVFLYDVLQKKNTILHNFPMVGHFRYMLENIGPELRQYVVANNREELPFNRIEGGWIYASSKNENNYEGFGTDQDIYAANYIFVKNAMMPFKVEDNHANHKDPYFLACAKVMGEERSETLE